LIEEGRVLVNGNRVKSTHAPRVGERIEIHWPEPIPAEAAPEEIPLEILFEDENLLVLNKAPGIVVHPSAGHDSHTLVNALLHHCAGQLSGIGGVARPGIVHRLDKETSGCLLVAKTDTAHVRLAEQFAGRSMEKHYDALVCGVVAADSGEINTPIARHPTQRKRMAVDPSAKREARTSFRVVERWRECTWIDALLHTGRTHQIRVHFEFLKHPVVGDTVYGRRANQKFAESTGRQAGRQLLHARSITFVHPKTGTSMRVEAPLPRDFVETLNFLRSRSKELPGTPRQP
jgi:23S rRNA pseudouridine1911/1915/1917 synthase